MIKRLFLKIGFCLVATCALSHGAINPDIVKGPYFFIQYPQESGLEPRSVPVQGFGSIIFRTTDFSFRVQSTNGKTSSGSGTYGINAESHIWASSENSSFLGITNGLVSSDGSFIAGGQDESTSQVDPSVFFFAIRAPSGGVATSDLKGTYSFIQSAAYATDEMFPSFTYTTSVGKMTFDGAGNVSFNHSMSVGNQRSDRIGSAGYTINADGSGTFTSGTAKMLLGVSADKNSFIAVSVSYTNSVAFMIGMRDEPGVVPSSSRFFGAYAPLRMAPDFSGLQNLNTDIPYMGLGDITADGARSTDGLIIEKYPCPMGEVFGMPFTKTYAVASSGKTEIRASNSPKIITGYQVGPRGNFIGAILNDPYDHGIAIAFRTGSFIGNSAVVDAAEFKAPVAPGSIVSIFGVGLGPWKGLATGLQPGGSRLKTESNGVSLTVNGVPCPLFYVSFNQVNCQMPFEVTGQTRVNLVATFAGITSPTEFARIAPVAPGLFQGAVANAITGRVISSALPARPGDYLVFYMTGLGQVDGGGITGQVVAGPQRVSAGFRAQINWKDVPLDYVGLTPGFVGLYQVNIRLPSDLPPGNASFNFSLRDNPLIGIAASFPVGN